MLCRLRVRRYFLYHIPVGGQPLHAVQIVLREPSCRLVLFQFQAPTLHAAQVAMHGQVERGVIPIYCLHEALHDNPRFQFLPYLAAERLLGRFARLHLASRELPEVLPLAIAPLCGKNLISLMDYRGYYFYAFHNISFFSGSPNCPVLQENLVERICQRLQCFFSFRRFQFTFPDDYGVPSH